MIENVFERHVAGYDAWYDTPRGAAIFREEADALRPLMADLPRPWLEVGVGSGRFAAELGVEYGIDAAYRPLLIARDRGISVTRAVGERLPAFDGSLGAVLLVVTLCFVRDPVAVLHEVRRVLRSDGRAVLGLVFAESSWGQHYRKLASEGHPYYREARFLTRADLTTLLSQAGLVPVRWRSTLYWAPTEEPDDARAYDGDDPRAGFSAVLVRPVVSECSAS